MNTLCDSLYIVSSLEKPLLSLIYSIYFPFQPKYKETVFHQKTIIQLVIS